tara:strand:- start:1748 stop:1918 length:171 start_codon:yes stop_codon:yes gene_type:complete
MHDMHDLRLLFFEIRFHGGATVLVLSLAAVTWAALHVLLVAQNRRRRGRLQQRAGF